MIRISVLFTATLACATGFYLPGVKPEDYQKGQQVPMTVDKMTSMRTQLPYEYYSMGFCKPDKGVTREKETLGEVLSGDMQETSNYELKMQESEFCKVVCKKTFTEGEIKRMHEFIDEEYRVNWIIDNLPGATRHPDYADEENPFYRVERGFPLGVAERPEQDTPGVKTAAPLKTRYYIYNHIHFKISFHRDVSFVGNRVVRFELTPYSVAHDWAGRSATPSTWEGAATKFKTCRAEDGGVKQSVPLLPQYLEKPSDEVVFTYDVVWEKSDVKWASRWDIYFEDAGPDEQIHWFSIINSLMIVLFLTGMVAMIMMRTLHRDISRYNEEATAEEVQEETGWKLVHGDIFRPPVLLPNLFSVLVGTGMQIFMMTLVLMVFAVLGFLSPANRGGLATAMVLLFIFMGSFAGYHAARMYKYFQGKHWKTNTLLTAFLFPGITYALFFIMNLFVWSVGSSAAIPFSTLVAMVCLWFGISVPLVFLGSYFGFRKDEMVSPVRTNQIPRQIPEQAWYLHPVISIAVGGVLPFGAVFIELFFIMSAVWLHQIYYVFGFLMLVLAILVVTCAEITVVMCYFQLCSEDYHWWWRSFLTSGSAAFYLYAYSILYFVTKLEMERFVSAVLYFGYMLIVALAFFLLTGSVGFLACFFFVRKIYGAIKVE